MERDKSKEDLGYEMFPQRDPRNRKRESFTSKLYRLNVRCTGRLNTAMETNPHVKLLLGAMSQAGCTAFKDRHFSCEDCEGGVGGGFDPNTSEVVICQNNINDQKYMDRVLTHELIHAYDYCRAQVDFVSNIRHLACSEIRAANLSGDCSLTNEMFRFNFGIKQHHQTCVKNQAVRSIMAARKVSQETAEKTVNEVFDSCFNDQEPFGRIPHNRTEANMAYKEFRNRGRYYANI